MILDHLKMVLNMFYIIIVLHENVKNSISCSNPICVSMGSPLKRSSLRENHPSELRIFQQATVEHIPQKTWDWTIKNWDSIWIHHSKCRFAWFGYQNLGRLSPKKNGTRQSHPQISNAFYKLQDPESLEPRLNSDFPGGWHWGTTQELGLFGLIHRFGIQHFPSLLRDPSIRYQ